jgi:hypothetical protein
VPAPLRIILALTFLSVYGVFAAWTLRRLYRSRGEGETPIIYHHGARGFGLAFWAAMTVLFTLRGGESSQNIWVRLVLVGFVTLPVSLWAGYFWGQQMNSFFGGKRS